MQYTFGSEKLPDLKQEVVICFVPEMKEVTGSYLKNLDQAGGGLLARAVSSQEFTGKTGEYLSFTNPEGWKTRRLILAGIGEAKKAKADLFRRAMGDLSRQKAVTQAKAVAVHFDNYADESFYQAAVEGYLLGSFKQRDYKTGEAAQDKSRLAHLHFAVGRPVWVKKAQQAVERGTVIAEGQNLVRELAQTPAGDLTPKIYAGKAQQLVCKHKISFKVLDEKAIAQEKMGAFLGVARGSEEPPRFLVFEYKGAAASQKPVVLVGKGVTFDSGGISLKPGLDMHEMKGDMTGSAVVLATMVTAARLKLKINLVGLTPLTENMPSGHATRPGDILVARSGKTIEVINTDAEGRLILADALDYANKFKPQAVIDIATLTGAALFVLGYAGAPILGNHDKLLKRIEAAAAVTAEKVWTMPIWDEHRDQMKSGIADLVNSGGRAAGTISAAAFLENFVGDWPWAHIDIAYVDIEHGGKPYIPKGATGIGLRLLIEVLSEWKKL
jgi:leucyl aminopeptidase